MSNWCRCGRRPAAWKRVYSHDRLGIEVAYTLGPKQHFAEKRVTLTFKQPCGLKRIIIGRAELLRRPVSGPCLIAIQSSCESPAVNRAAHIFGRTAKGGFFTGVEMTFDVSRKADNGWSWRTGRA